MRAIEMDYWRGNWDWLMHNRNDRGENGCQGRDGLRRRKNDYEGGGRREEVLRLRTCGKTIEKARQNRGRRQERRMLKVTDMRQNNWFGEQEQQGDSKTLSKKKVL